MFAFGDLVDSVRPGDRVEITGVFRAVPRRVNPRHRNISSIYKTYIDIIHIRRADISHDEAAVSNTTRNTSSNTTVEEDGGEGQAGEGAEPVHTSSDIGKINAIYT